MSPYAQHIEYRCSLYEEEDSDVDFLNLQRPLNFIFPNEIARNFRGTKGNPTGASRRTNRFAAPPMSINNDWYVDAEHPLFLIVRRKCSSSTTEFLLFSRILDCIQMQIRLLRVGLFRGTWNNYSPFYYKFQVLI